MKNDTISFVLLFFCLYPILTSCEKEYDSNGETIFRTGKNLKGEMMQDRNSSQRNAIYSCQDCHGRTGGNIINKDESIKYKDLIDPALRIVPYNDELIKRFLDEELKSDGTKANTGIVWKMSDKDKTDLIEFLKTL